MTDMFRMLSGLSMSARILRNGQRLCSVWNAGGPSPASTYLLDCEAVGQMSASFQQDSEQTESATESIGIEDLLDHGGGVDEILLV